MWIDGRVALARRDAGVAIPFKPIGGQDGPDASSLEKLGSLDDGRKVISAAPPSGGAGIAARLPDRSSRVALL
jgi:hypothetical protein